MEGWPDLAGDCFFLFRKCFTRGERSTSSQRRPECAQSVPRFAKGGPGSTKATQEAPNVLERAREVPSKTRRAARRSLEGRSTVAPRLLEVRSMVARRSLEGRSQVARRSPEGFSKVGAIHMIKSNLRPSSCTISQLCLQCSCSTFPACIYTACFHIQKSTQKFDAHHRGRALVSPNVILQLITW